jgi:hypothetical protein
MKMVKSVREKIVRAQKRAGESFWHRNLRKVLGTTGHKSGFKCGGRPAFPEQAKEYK